MFITTNSRFGFNSIGLIFFLKAQETAKLNTNASSREYNLGCLFL